MGPGAQKTLELDALVIGGGICGLWALSALRERGHAAALVERDALGSGQTIASQGIIHGGTKYALNGEARDASRMISRMPERWKLSMRGEASPDLRGVEVLSEQCVLWTSKGIGSKLTGIAASRAIRVTPNKLRREDAPSPFNEAPRGVDCYRLDEPVLDPSSLLKSFRDSLEASLIKGSIVLNEEGSITIETSNAQILVRAKHVVITAGGGGFALASSLLNETDTPEMQKRPLHMVMARGDDLPMVFGHAVGVSSTPRLTITSQRDREGRVVWWIGGQIAERGVSMSSDDVIERARSEIDALLPWVETRETQFATLEVDRAEGRSPGGKRPDGPVIESRASGDMRVHICWPTKLAFAPAVAEELSSRIGDPVIRDQPLLDAPVPDVAPLPWDEESTVWTR